jgi:hypothetical protein
MNVDPDLPACGSIDPDLPGCSVGNDSFLDSDFKMDGYILKTKIVTPVCPNNPYDNVGSDINKKDTPKTVDLKPVNTRDISYNFPSLSTRDISNNFNNSVPSINTYNINHGNDSNSNSNNNPNPFNYPNNFFSPNNVLSTPEKPVEPAPAKPEEKKSNPEDLSKCPPCPACERCPEPTVDCKKVVHYKNKQYPVPLIADFSQFSRF